MMNQYFNQGNDLADQTLNDNQLNGVQEGSQNNSKEITLKLKYPKKEANFEIILKDSYTCDKIYQKIREIRNIETKKNEYKIFVSTTSGDNVPESDSIKISSLLKNNELVLELNIDIVEV
eukprot:TRINITY_DN10437_c0_g1_i4.p2 TRINITY_DN10437_c0_g1~~TRINITY_DN10437_c0_g1_i4.p2  ORF type:complete len:120 (+),score=32.56 TRINITY_DN10437_c0_g1_i4:181-540(+)